MFFDPNTPKGIPVDAGGYNGMWDRQLRLTWESFRGIQESGNPIGEKEILAMVARAEKRLENAEMTDRARLVSRAIVACKDAMLASLC